MIRQWGVTPNVTMAEQPTGDSVIPTNMKIEKMPSSEFGIMKSKSSHSVLAVVSAPAPPGCDEDSRVISVAIGGGNEDDDVIDTDDEDDDDSEFDTEDDEGLSTLYEEEEAETVDDITSNFQYYSIDDVDLDEVSSQYEKRSIATPAPRDITPTPEDDGENVTPTPDHPHQEMIVSGQPQINPGDVTPVVSHARQNSDDVTGVLVRRKGMRSKKPHEKQKHNIHEDLQPSALSSNKLPGRESSFREFLKEAFEKAIPPRESASNAMTRPGNDYNRVVNTDYSITPPQSEVTESGLMSARSETSLSSGMSALTARPQHFVVVAVDFGTTYSGYAFSFVDRPDSIHMMRRWAGGDPGISNQKTPTTLLLKPSGAFHSFGFEARDFYHDLDPAEARNWFYFERFKMALHSNLSLSKTTQLVAANRKPMPAIQVFAHALRFFKQHALQELTDELGTQMRTNDVRWVVTVPAIWRPQAKQFMREAAYQAGLASEENPNQLVIALEPEAASIYCRKLRNTQLQASSRDELTVQETLKSGCQYMVVDCGGGTVDVTVHMVVGDRTLQEVRAASGGAMGSVAVDAEFEKLLRDIFGNDFIDEFRRKRPAGAVDLFVAWESRKRSASPSKNCSLNISLPFSFIDLHRKMKQTTVEEVVKKYNDVNVKWSSQGMLRITPSLMRRLFQPTLDAIVNHVASQIDPRISHLFLVGGFAESPLLQQQLRHAVGDRVRVIIPNDVSLTILKGAVLFGLDPTTVRMRTSQMTYGVGILNAYDASKHPSHKRLLRDGHIWCTDIFDAYVIAGSMVGLGDVVQRSYAPVRRDQNTVVINLYSCERSDVKFIDEEGVQKCATLRVHLPSTSTSPMTSSKRELQISMMYGDTEIKVHCLDVVTGTKVNASIDFLSK